MLFFFLGTPVFVKGAVLSAKGHFVNFRLTTGTKRSKQCEWIQCMSSRKKVANTGFCYSFTGVFQMPLQCVIYLFHLEVVDARLP